MIIVVGKFRKLKPNHAKLMPHENYTEKREAYFCINWKQEKVLRNRLRDRNAHEIYAVKVSCLEYFHVNAS